MKFSETSKYFDLNRQTYVNLRWIAIIGQFTTINTVKFVFDFEFDYVLSNIIVFLGLISNFYLVFSYKENFLSNKVSFLFLSIDILQLSFLFYLTGGIMNPFVIFIIFPGIFSSTNLDIKNNIALCSITIISIIFLTFFGKDLPSPLDTHFNVSNYFFYSVPLALIVALVFLNYFGLKFGAEARIRREALDKMEEIMAKESELLSLGGQAAAAAHSFGTPLSTIKIISQELLGQLKDNKNVVKDIELLISQVNRCNDILKRLTLDPIVEDEFIDNDISLYRYMVEIIKSFEEISDKKFLLNTDQDLNSLNFFRSIEIVYGLRNFIGNANKFANQKIFISIKSDSKITNVVIEDDGNGFPKDVLNKIGTPYLKSLKKDTQSKFGLGLGIFIGKTLLERNKAKIIFRNSVTRGGAEINITWNNKDLLNL